MPFVDHILIGLPIQPSATPMSAPALLKMIDANLENLRINAEEVNKAIPLGGCGGSIDSGNLFPACARDYWLLFKQVTKTLGEVRRAIAPAELLN